MSEKVAEGDMESQERGSAARMNDGKLPLELVPVRMLISWWTAEYNLTTEHPSLTGILQKIANWQERREDIWTAWSSFPFAARDDVVRVLEFGSQKYAAWNWAKGQRWGCTLGSLLRHAEKILQGEMLDADSGLPHWGHIGCNLCFLCWFRDHYPDGDDRPPVYDEEGKLI